MSETLCIPSTRTISAVLPPSSETGRTCATRVVTFFNSSTTPLNAVPPEVAQKNSQQTTQSKTFHFTLRIKIKVIIETHQTHFILNKSHQ